MDVREGRVQITIDGVVTVAKAGDKPVHIPAGAVHALKSFPGERVVVRESADPPGEYKHLCALIPLPLVLFLGAFLTR